LELGEQLKINSNCQNFFELPDIKIVLKSRKSYKSKETKEDSIILKPEDYIIEGKRIKTSLEISKNDKNGDFGDFFSVKSDECQPAFMPIDVPAPRGPIFVFGEYFLRKYYTVFDRDEMVMGFALANHNTEDNKHIIDIQTPYDDIKNSKVKLRQNEGMKEANKFFKAGSLLDDDFTQQLGLNSSGESNLDLDISSDDILNDENSNNDETQPPGVDTSIVDEFDYSYDK
jgi:hypothetical protein